MCINHSLIYDIPSVIVILPDNPIVLVEATHHYLRVSDTEDHYGERIKIASYAILSP